MPVRMFQNIIYRIRDIINYDFGIADNSGIVIASSISGEAGTIISECQDILNSNKSYMNINGMSFKKIKTQNRSEYIAYIHSANAENEKYLNLISISVESIKQFYDEKFDKNSFMKSVILGSILPGDIHLKAKELSLKSDVRRVVYLIRTYKTKDLSSYNIISSLFPGTSKDFVILLDEENTVLVKELKDSDDKKEIYRKARVINDTLNTELMVKSFVGIGTVVNSLRETARSYKEAQTALEIGGIFETDRDIDDYNRLGIGRLIYQLPTTLCKLFLNEVFKVGAYESIDNETMLTIQKFFENNLNVSETSRQLYIHRNTLVYRLDKILKLTGMDLRKFDDAIYFKVAMMVKLYLDKMSD